MFSYGYHDPEFMAAVSKGDNPPAQTQAALAVAFVLLWLAGVWLLLPILGL